ncbi:MAG: SRPBCC family protein [Actinobacteria bacterium]|nr:SRPBCC family protein [Actinomycetota bacterium]
MGYAEARTWLAVGPEEVFDHITDPTRWPAWLPVAEADPDAGVRLHEVGATAAGRVLGRRDRPAVNWEVVRRRRLNVHLDGHKGTSVIARLHLSASPWDGGCLFEARYDSVPTALDLRFLPARMRRGVATLARGFEAGVVAVTSAREPQRLTPSRPVQPGTRAGVSGPRPI